MKHLGIRVENELDIAIAKAAAIEEKSKSEYIREAILEKLNEQNQSYFGQILSKIEAQNTSLNLISRAIEEQNVKKNHKFLSKKLDFIIAKTVYNDFSDDEKAEYISDLNRHLEVL